jgi:hypothetical protein
MKETEQEAEAALSRFFETLATSIETFISETERVAVILLLERHATIILVVDFTKPVGNKRRRLGQVSLYNFAEYRVET